MMDCLLFAPPVALQTYGLQQKNATVTEMCTFVCTVHEDSAAESAGLTAGEPQKHSATRILTPPSRLPISCGLYFFLPERLALTHNLQRVTAEPTVFSITAFLSFPRLRGHHCDHQRRQHRGLLPPEDPRPHPRIDQLEVSVAAGDEVMGARWCTAGD